MSEGGAVAGEERARRAVESWPDDAVVVGLIARPGEGDRVCADAVRLAEASAADRTTLLANLAGADPDLDGHLGVAAEEGLLAAGRSRRSLGDLVRRPGGGRVPYLPAGPAGADEQGRALAVRLVPLLEKVADGVRQRQGRLLLVLRAGTEWTPALSDLLDGVVLLGTASVPARGDEAPPVLGRFSRRTDGSAAGPSPRKARAGDPERRPGSSPAGSGSAWRRHRRSGGLPWARIVLGVAAIAVLAGGWWWLARRAAPAKGEPGGADRPVATDTAAASVARAGDDDGAPAGDDSVRPAAGGAAADTAEGTPPAGRDPRAVMEASPELGYSVLIASYARRSQARRRLERWRDPDGPVYYTTPMRVRGGVYWRVLAGAVEDRASGEALMERLVEQGRKDRARTWDVRPVRLAFLSSSAESRDAARQRVDALEDRGVPAYALPAASEGDTVWAVYSGGFESARDAAELRALLEEAGVEAELVTRRGESDVR